MLGGVDTCPAIDYVPARPAILQEAGLMGEKAANIAVLLKLIIPEY